MEGGGRERERQKEGERKGKRKTGEGGARKEWREKEDMIPPAQGVLMEPRMHTRCPSMQLHLVQYFTLVKLNSSS